MTPIELMALIVIIAGVVKILVILINPKSWTSLVRKVYSNNNLAAIISFILALITLYYLIQSGLTIVHIFAVMLFVALLAGVSISRNAKEVASLMDKMVKKGNIWKQHWLSLVIWILLLAWGLVVLFA